MLRHVRIKNFLNFPADEWQVVDFDEGAYFFIGPNNSGKTSVFEAIRRCLSFRQNTSLSKPKDQSKCLGVVCVYDILKHVTRPDGVNYQNYETQISFKENTKGKLINILSGEMCVDKYIFIKTVIYYDTKGFLGGMELVKENKDGQICYENVEFLFNDDIHETINDFFKSSKNESYLEHLIQIITSNENVKERREIFAKNNDYQKVNDDIPPCERILRDYLDDAFVATLPQRGIGPCQWTKSELVNADDKEENYRKSMDQSEILKWFMTKKIKTITKKETERERRYFQLIADSSRFKFVDVDNKIYAKVGLPCEETNIPLLKVPEGILEAKICSILLAVDDFTTIGLEDPDRGMHPQMVVRLRDLVLHQIKTKVVFITTHQQSFLNYWTLPRIFFFRNLKGMDTRGEFKIVTPDKIEKSVLEIMKPSFLNGTIHFPTIFFAEKIMFVEGVTDFMFLDTFKTLIMNRDPCFDSIIPVKQQLIDIQTFLASLQIMHLGGEGFKNRFEDLCVNLQIERYFLLDKDAVVLKSEIKRQRLTKRREPKKTKATIDGMEEGKKEITEERLFSNSFKIKMSQNEIDDDVTKLEKEGIFVWKQGNFENALHKFVIDHQENVDLITVLKEYNILESDMNTKSDIGDTDTSQTKESDMNTKSDKGDTDMSQTEESGMNVKSYKGDTDKSQTEESDMNVKSDKGDTDKSQTKESDMNTKSDKRDMDKSQTKESLMNVKSDKGDTDKSQTKESDMNVKSDTDKSQTKESLMNVKSDNGDTDKSKTKESNQGTKGKERENKYKINKLAKAIKVREDVFTIFRQILRCCQTEEDTDEYYRLLMFFDRMSHGRRGLRFNRSRAYESPTAS